MLRVVVKETSHSKTAFVWEIHQSDVLGGFRKVQSSHTSSFLSFDKAKEDAMTQVEYRKKSQLRKKEVEASAVSFDIEDDTLLPAPILRSPADDLADAIRAIVEEAVGHSQ